jgi:hypothetical protein
MGILLQYLVDVHSRADTIANRDGSLPENAVFNVTYEVEDAQSFEISPLGE